MSQLCLFCGMDTAHAPSCPLHTFGGVYNLSGIEPPKPGCRGWTAQVLDEFCLEHQLLWEPHRDGTAIIFGPCGRECHCHDGRREELRPDGSTGHGKQKAAVNHAQA